MFKSCFMTIFQAISVFQIIITVKIKDSLR